MYHVKISDFDPISRHMVVVHEFDVEGEEEARKRSAWAKYCGLAADYAPV